MKWNKRMNLVSSEHKTCPLDVRLTTSLSIDKLTEKYFLCCEIYPSGNYNVVSAEPGIKVYPTGFKRTRRYKNMSCTHVLFWFLLITLLSKTVGLEKDNIYR